MTPEEREMLSDLANKIAQTPTPAHDPEADQFIRTNIGNRPDALYILTQTALIQNLAIQHAHQEIQELKQRLAQPAAPAQSGSSFLGMGTAPRPSGVAGAAPPPPAAPMPPPLPQSGAPAGGGGSSFLRSAAQTAAGVAAGALAFEGIRALFGGGGFGGFGMPHLGNFGGGSFLGGAPGGETIINNYYDSPEAADSSVSDVDDSTVADDADSSYDDTSADDDTLADDGGYDNGGDSGGDDFV